MMRALLLGFLAHWLKAITNTFPYNWRRLSNNGIGLVLIAEGSGPVMEMVGIEKETRSRAKVAIYAAGFVTGIGNMLGYRVDPLRRKE